MKITRIGLDLAKNVFQVFGVDAHDKRVLSRQLKRKEMHAFFQDLPACLIGMEACASAHYWAWRRLPCRSGTRASPGRRRASPCA